MNKKIHNMAVFIEFLVGSGLAIFFHWVLRHEEVAYVTFSIGLLLSLATWLLREDVEKSRDTLIEQYQQTHEIPAALARISDPECHGRATELIASTQRTLLMLEKGYIPLDDSEFYLEGAKLSDSASRSIKAVDPMTPGWGTRGTLLNFYQANLRALEQGVPITRIFVINRDDLADPEVQKVLLAQHGDRVNVRVAFRDELPAASNINGRDTTGSCNFAIYDDQVVTDVFTQPGKYYGRKTSQHAEVERYQRLYELIEHSAHHLAPDGGSLTVASEVYAIAPELAHAPEIPPNPLFS